MRSPRLALIAGAAIAALAISVPVTAHAADGGRAGTAATTNTADLAVNAASVAGRVKSASYGLSLTFVFSGKNNGPATAEPVLDITTVTNLTNSDSSQYTCVSKSGVAYEGDTPGCEPGYVASGVSMGANVFTGLVTAFSGATATVRACVYDIGGIPDPVPSNNCKTLNVPIR